jgi:hypothetical protein
MTPEILGGRVPKSLDAKCKHLVKATGKSSVSSPQNVEVTLISKPRQQLQQAVDDNAQAAAGEEMIEIERLQEFGINAGDLNKLKAGVVLSDQRACSPLPLC